MEFRILGPLEVWSDQRRLPLGGSKQRMLLAVLLLHRNEVVSIDRLVEELWTGQPPATAVKVLQVYVSQLRKAFGGRRTPSDAEDVLVTRAPGYLLRVGREELDADRFERLVEEGRRVLGAGSPRLATRTLLEALADQRSRISPTSPLRNRRSGDSRRFICLRSPTASTPTSRLAATRRSSASWRRSSPRTRFRSACAAS